MIQESQPDADVAAGHWLPTPVFSRINDPYPGDATFVSSPGLPGAGDTFEVAMAPLAAPAAGPQTLTVRLRKTGACPAWAWVSLVDETDGGPVVIAARLVNPAADFADYDLALTAGEAAQITNYGTLILRVTAVGGGSSSCSESAGSSASGGPSGSSGLSAGSSGSRGSSAASFASGGASVSSAASVSPPGSSGSSAADSSSSSSSGASSASGRSSSSGVYAACCGDNFHYVLYATFGGETGGCGCWGAPTVALTWNGIAWQGVTDGCGFEGLALNLMCTGGAFRLFVATNNVGGVIHSCQPALLTFTFTHADQTYCDGSFTVTVTETAP